MLPPLSVCIRHAGLSVWGKPHRPIHREKGRIRNPPTRLMPAHPPRPTNLKLGSLVIIVNVIVGKSLVV